MPNEELIIHRTKQFLKAFQKLKKPLQLKALERIELFLVSSAHPLLKVHALSGELQGISSLNVSGDYRIWFLESKAGNKRIITFLNIGSHSQLY